MWGQLVCIFLIAGLGGLLPASAQEPLTTTRLLEQLTEVDTLYQPPETRSLFFSSFDEQGGNADGQGWLRQEGDEFVIAETPGPGAITRIWTPNPQGTIRIYVDDESEPLIERPFLDLFIGKLIPFESPFVKASLRTRGAHWSLLPIPFADSCKITLSEPVMYQVEAVVYPVGNSVEPLRIPFPRRAHSIVDSLGRNFERTVESAPEAHSDWQSVEAEEDLAPGESKTLASLQGPAVIRLLKMRWPADRRANGRSLLLQITWDDEKQPGVVAPLYDFMGGGMRTAIAGMQDDGWTYMTLPMPFVRSATVVVQNDGPRRIEDLEMALHYEEDAGLPSNVRHLRAHWQRNLNTDVNPVPLRANRLHPLTEPQQSFRGLDVRGEGHLVGLLAFHSIDETGDAAIYIDQAQWPPQWAGTGEQGIFNLDRSAIDVDEPLHAGTEAVEDVRGVMRWFPLNPPAFQQRLRVEFEHGHANLLRQDWSLLSFWYGAPPQTNLPWPLPGPGRQFREQPPAQVDFIAADDRLIPEALNEAEDLPVSTMGGFHEPRDMRPYGPDWSEGSVMAFEGYSQNAFIEFERPAPQYSGFYTFTASVAATPNSGRAKVVLENHELISQVDLFSRTIQRKTLQSAEPLFLHAKIPLPVKWMIVGKNAQSEGYGLFIDRFDFVGLPAWPTQLSFQGPTRMALPAASANAEALPRWPMGTKQEGFQERTLAVAEGEPFRLPKAGENSSSGYARLGWAVEARQAGVYRFEVRGEAAEPFLLARNGRQLAKKPRHVLINGIALSAQNETRIDPVTIESRPARFALPLQPGQNRIEWMVDLSQCESLQPVIFGLNPE